MYTQHIVCDSDEYTHTRAHTHTDTVRHSYAYVEPSMWHLYARVCVLHILTYFEKKKKREKNNTPMY